MTSIVTGSIRHILAALVVAALSAAGTNAAPSHGDTPSGSTSTADHAKFEQLNRTFETGPEVTKACLSCHTEAAKQIHTTTHWTWDYINPETGQRLGKMNVVNNFCISAKPNIEQCSSCHVGYGWSKAPYDFTSEENVDCLVCHDTTGEYSRAQLRNPGKRKPKLKKFAQNVGKTSRQTCGTCHFSGGGDKAVKHGDIDPSLNHPDMFIDVHMDADGLNFTCSTCHASDAHAVAGSRYAPDAKDTHGIDVPGRDDRSRASCESCHGLTPHESEDDGDKLNDHTDRVACQTCHIPTYSRGGFASKTWWDWSEAGRMTADGAPLVEHDINGHKTYNGKKGSFVWLKDVVPEYVWFNGRVRYTLVGDPVDPSGIVPVNTFEGSPDDPDSRIWPAKVMRGKQPYDTGSQALVAVKTTGFEIHQTYALLGYHDAAEFHRLFAWSLIGLWVFAIFWHFVTGEWRQYVPTTRRLMAVVQYYTIGIFSADVPHPHKKTKLSKHNPLQRLAYLSLKVAINPVLVASGLLYMYVNDWPAIGLGFLSLDIVALVHVAAAFAMLVFLIAHVYMAFTGKPVLSYMQAMVTGYEPAEE